MKETPVLKLMDALGRDGSALVDVSYIGEGVQWTPRRIAAAYADSLVEALTDQGFDVYIGVSEMRADLDKGRGAVADVVQVNALWADIDYKDAGMGSYEKARALVDALADVLGVNPVAIVRSGHGLQPWWALEDGETAEVNRLGMVALLARWGLLVKQYARSLGGKVDGVFDIARVLRAPGSVNHKDPENPVAVEIEFTEWSRPVSTRELDNILIDHQIIEGITADVLDPVVVPISTWEPADHDCPWITSTFIPQIERGPAASGRHPWLLGVATTLQAAARFGCLTEETHTLLAQDIEARFERMLTEMTPPRKMSPGEVGNSLAWAADRVSTFTEVKLADALGYHKALHLQTAEASAPFSSPSSSDAIVSELRQPVSLGSSALAEDAEAIITPLPKKEIDPAVLGANKLRFTDTANADRLAMKLLGTYIYVPGIGWHEWGGAYFRPLSGGDNAPEVVQAAKAAVRKMVEESKDNEAVAAWAMKSLSGRGIRDTMFLVRSVPELIVPATKLDASAYELATPLGVINLNTAAMRTADPGTDFNTRITALAPAPGKPKKYLAFLSDVLLGNQELMDYMQRLAGMALIGEVRWQMLPVLEGVGANGKSALLAMWHAVLGTYAMDLPGDYLAARTNAEHPTKIAMLRGVRLAIAAEVDPNSVFDEQLVKQLTGEKTLTARTMGKDFFNFTATHTIFLLANHMPMVKTGGKSFWRRIKRIRFNRVYKESEQNENLVPEMIAAEGPQILNWMIEGARAVIAEGMKEPAMVTAATAAYEAQEDVIAQFVTECTRLDDQAGFTMVDVYQAFSRWMRRRGMFAWAAPQFQRELMNRYGDVLKEGLITNGSTGSQVKGFTGMELLYAVE